MFFDWDGLAHIYIQSAGKEFLCSGSLELVDIGSSGARSALGLRLRRLGTRVLSRLSQWSSARPKGAIGEPNEEWHACAEKPPALCGPGSRGHSSCLPCLDEYLRVHLHE